MSEISCRISNTFISYVKNTRPEFLQPLLDGLGYDEKYLSDPDNWIPWETEQLLEERLTHLFDDERIMFKIGRSILKFKSLGIVNMLLRLFMTPELLILYTPKIARYFTKDIVNIDVINTTRESAIVELKIKGRQTRGACLYNQGMFSIITELFGLEAASVSELQCVVPLHEAGKINGHFYMVNEKGEVKELKEQGDAAGATRRVAPAAIGRVSENGTFKLGDTLFGAESCIYQINWKNKWRSSLHNRIFEKRRVLTDAIRHLEESHAKIQEAYERVRKSEERYRELIENASDIIIFLDSEDEITSINKKGIELFGYSHSEITGRKFLFFVDDIDKEKAAKELSKSLSGNTCIFEVIAKKKDDEQLILSVNSTPIREDGKIIGIMVIIARTEEEKRQSFRLRFETMCRDLGWLPTGDYALEEEWDEYDMRQSIIFLAIDGADRSIGTGRLILPGEEPLPIEKHFNLYPEELVEAVHGKMGYCVEVSRFIVPQNPSFKNHDITLLIIRAMIHKCMDIGVTHLLTSCDYRFFRLLRALGFYLSEIGESKLFMGSKTIPGILSVKKLPEILLEKNPRLYDYIMSRDGQVEDAVLV